jgi:hypothetical protein
MLNTGVVLCSVQFLGLAYSVANALASSCIVPGEEEKAFIRDTFQVSMEHFQRWGDDCAISSLRRPAAAMPQDLKTGCSSLFFMGRSLWLMAICRALAGILQGQ